MIRRAASLPPLAIALLCLCAGGAWARSSDRNQSTHIGADSNDCWLNESAPCTFTGNVKIEQGTLDIQAAKAVVRRGSGGEADSIKLTGAPVKLKQQTDDGGWMNASAAQIDYDMSSDTIVFSGKASVVQPGKGSISGERIVYNMETGRLQSGAAAGGGRVNMTFEPKNKAPAGDADKAEDAEPPKQDDE